MKEKIYGYVRVSSTDQNEDRQVIKMREVGIGEEDIFIDKVSGKEFDRPQYNTMVKKIKKDDILYILSIDRLGRNYEEIQEQWRVITKEKGADIVVLDMPLLDTRQQKDLLGTFIADIVLQVLSFSAHMERDCIRERQAQGISAAKARGVKFGRKRIPMSDELVEMIEIYREGKTTIRSAAKKIGVSPATFCRRLKNYEDE